jgi:hypothetical protein
MFKSNVGSVDRVLRIIVGIAALALFFVYPEASWRNWTLIGIVPLVTGLFSNCPAYTIFGLSSCPIKKA